MRMALFGAHEERSERIENKLDLVLDTIGSYTHMENAIHDHSEEIKAINAKVNHHAGIAAAIAAFAALFTTWLGVRH